MTDFVDSLTDAELRTKLAEYGFPVVPITTTTRKVMAKKLKMLIENKNKINSEGRRSLAKFSSEEESDEDIKTKKDKSRRVTVGPGMLPPAVNKTRKSTRKVDTTAHNDDNVSASSTVTTETKTRRTTRIIKPVLEEDLETGSDSEPEIVDEYTNNDSSHAERAHSSFTSDSAKPLASSSFSRSYNSGTYLSPRSPLGQGVTEHVTRPVPAPSSSGYASSTRYTTSTTHDSAADNSFDKLNQIRSRLSLSTNYDRPIFGSTLDRKTLTGTGDGDAPADPPFLSNFSKRLSQLSSKTTLKPEYSYKNDIIKEHDANGSSFTRSYLNRLRNREYPHDFKSSQEKNIFKNNIVSFTLLAILIAFFAVIFVMYWGIKTDSVAVGSDKSVSVPDYMIPFCTDGMGSKPGINCVGQEDSTDALNLLKVLQPELSKRSIAYHCANTNAKPYMNDDHIIEFVSTNYALKDPYEIQKAINNLQVLVLKNPKWGISIIHTDKFPTDGTALENMDQILGNRARRNLAMTVLNPELPWKCIIFNKLYTIISSILVIAIGFSTIFLSQRGYKYILRQRKLKNDQIYSMVEKIIDILQSNAADNTENFLAVNHVRDMLIPPQDRKRMASVWSGAEKFLQENESRVRTEIQIVAGEEFHVWRWLGNPNLNSTSSPRSKSWQGQAFETQVGSVNSLPCSPTPCLKIRGMFDERERNLYTVREAVLSKCANKCKILHCEADLTSSCVYLKCANQAEAAVAYQNLHGWWYDGRLVTVKYLRLERYMQRFPDSPAKGPPFQTPSTSQPVENDWSNNDD